MSFTLKVENLYPQEPVVEANVLLYKTAITWAFSTIVSFNFKLKKN